MREYKFVLIGGGQQAYKEYIAPLQISSADCKLVAVAVAVAESNTERRKFLEGLNLQVYSDYN